MRQYHVEVDQRLLSVDGTKITMLSAEEGGTPPSSAEMQEMQYGVDSEAIRKLQADSVPKCSTCGVTHGLSKCTGCRVKQYCSRACQAADWKAGGHKEECTLIRVIRKGIVPKAPDGAILFETLDIFRQQHVSTAMMVMGVKQYLDAEATDLATGYCSGLWNSVECISNAKRHPCPSDAADVASVEARGGSWCDLLRKHFGEDGRFFSDGDAISPRKPSETYHEQQGPIVELTEDEARARRSVLMRHEGVVAWSGRLDVTYKPFSHCFPTVTELVGPDGTRRAFLKQRDFDAARAAGEAMLISRAATPSEASRIAFIGPRLTLNQRRFIAEDTSETSDTTILAHGPVTFAAPRGQSYFTIAQLGAVLHAYFYRPNGRFFGTEADISGVDDIKCFNGDQEYGCWWL